VGDVLVVNGKEGLPEQADTVEVEQSKGDWANAKFTLLIMQINNICNLVFISELVEN
jgi:hypothetical protein